MEVAFWLLLSLGIAIFFWLCWRNIQRSRHERINKVLTAVLTIAALATGQSAMAQVTGSGTESDPYVVTTWDDLRTKMAAGGYIRLDADVAYPDKTTNSYLSVPSDKTVTLNLNGHKIDRALTTKTSNGYVIKVAGNLTVNDSGTGGKITGGNSSSDSGGGVYVYLGTFTMSGGTITGNETTGSSSHGGGVQVYGGTFTMQGGNITGNRTQTSGGGVYISSGSSTFTMSGGTISGNTAEGNKGGGVYVNSGTFNMSGGTISNNEAVQKNVGGNLIGYGGGVYVQYNGTFKISGNPVISGNLIKEINNGTHTDNVYLDASSNKSSVITIDAALTEGASIGVTMGNPGVFTSDWKTKMGENASPTKFFTSDNAAYTMSQNVSGEALLGYTVTFDSDGGSAVATQTVIPGGTATQPTDPTKGEMCLLGWYKVTGGQMANTAFDFNTAINENTTLKAKWGYSITITADNATKTYDGTALTQGGFTVTGQATTDTYTFTVTMTAESTITNVGSTANVIATVDGEDVTTGTTKVIGNYLVTTANGTLEVTARVTNYGCITFTETGNAATTTIVLNGDTETSIVAPTGDITGKVTLNRSFTKDTKSTICLPFDVTATNAAALGKFYQFDGLKDGTTDIVKMKEVTTALVANTPYIFEPSADCTAIDFGQQTIAASPSASASTSGTSNEFVFQGTYNYKKWQDGDAELTAGIYGFLAKEWDGHASGYFLKGVTNTTIKPFRAYLKYTGNLSNTDPATNATRGSTRSGSLPEVIEIEWVNAKGETTGIRSIDNGQWIIDNSWYSLDGRKLSGKPTKKGLYINNGKKVVIR